MTSLPKSLPLDLSKCPKLSSEQAGHLHHFYNIGTSLDGNWPHMGTQNPDQAFLDAYRYQLATMAYAAGLAHYHRLPVMRSLFKLLIRNLIRKMLRNEVWSYWYLIPQAGNRLDPELQQLRKPRADPIVKENIMYSGYLLLMTSLAMLFDPLFWGFGPEKFEYDNASLQKAVLKEMERGGWVGVCCSRTRLSDEKRGLYYPRQDTVLNEVGEWTFLDPFSGNATIGYARLNVEDGQRKMWETPWTTEVLAGRPWADGLDLGHGVDCLRGA
ncbi:hypothetical protein ACJ73_01694 [Blastomyces percursus]|uniref:Linalool dehydratase/isomerase domain-containing protein n=1 Tax=Blastomyces percursus TaxID=1658174 RepID=A0A1J9RH22_9EURO|nr:hypothetical protein ACJ73_01694 [Blastomyces percursus]